MKRIIGLLLLLLICKISFSQTFPSTLPVSSPNQMYKALGGFTAGVGFINTQYADTLTANANSYIKNYPFAQIATSDGSVYYRNQTATAWIKFNTSVSAGTLTNFAFTNLNGLNGVVTNPASTPNLTLSTPLNGLIRANGTSFLTTTIGTGLAFDGTTLSATNSGTVLDVGSNSLNPIFNSSVANASTHPVISYTLQPSAAYTILGNNTNSSATQTYFTPVLASTLFRNQGTSTTLLHGTVSGNPFWGQVVTPDIADNAVTFIKMQAINAQTLLGNNKSYGGLVREITIGGGLTLDTATAILSADNVGTVSNIGLTVPSIFSVTPATITTSGTFVITANATKGDIIYAIANNSYAKLSIGTSKQHLGIRSGLPIWLDTVVANTSTFISVAGTANRITVANGTTNATVDIASNYVGQPSITTLSNTTGVTTGIWKATKIDVPYGGLNLTSVTLGGIPYGSSSNVYSIIPAGTQGQLLRINSNIPQWFTPTYLLPADTSGKWLTHVHRIADSVKEVRGGIDYFSFIDSTGITSFTNANGFAGTIASKSLTLSTTFTGLAFSDGTGLSAVNIGTGLTLNNSTKLLDWNGVNVRKGGVAPTFTERMINLIEGSGMTITVGDDPGNNRVNVTLTSTGGSGNTNSNIGSGYRWAIPNTNNIKTFFGDAYIHIDSTTNTNALTVKFDTTLIHTSIYNDGHYLTDINAYLQAGTNITISGSGTLGSPYVINSSGGGGSGGTNVNIGSGYRWAIPGTNNVKTYFAGTYLLLDSSSNANAITLKIDTAAYDLTFSNLSPLFTTTKTGRSVSFLQQSAAAHTFFGNFTGSSGNPAFGSPILASADFANQGTTTTLLHGNASGNPSWTQVLTADIATANVTYAKIQNVTTQKLLGRYTVGSGVVQEISLSNNFYLDPTTGQLSIDWVTSQTPSWQMVMNNGNFSTHPAKFRTNIIPSYLVDKWEIGVDADSVDIGNFYLKEDSTSNYALFGYNKVLYLGGNAKTSPSVTLAFNKDVTLSGYPSSRNDGAVTSGSTKLVYVDANGKLQVGTATFAAGSGTVTSVALSDGSTTPIYTISGSPVTSSGTLTVTLATQTTNKVFAAPNGSTGQPSFRALVAADIPALANLTATDATLTFSGIYNGSTARTIGLNLGNANTWTGAQTLGSNLLIATSPKISTDISDANGNEVFKITATSSAVNEFTIANAATGGNPKLTASGGDSNIGLDFLLKGTGTFNLTGNATQAAELRLYEVTGDGTNYTALKVGTQATDLTYTLPTAYPTTSGYALTSTTAGVMSWTNPVNIYNSNGTLTGDRALSGNAKYLWFSGVKYMQISTSVAATSGTSATDGTGIIFMQGGMAYNTAVITPGSSSSIDSITNITSAVLCKDGSGGAQTIALPQSLFDGRVLVISMGALTTSYTISTSLKDLNGNTVTTLTPGYEYRCFQPAAFGQWYCAISNPSSSGGSSSGMAIGGLITNSKVSSIPFVGAGGKLSQDSSHFRYDSSNAIAILPKTTISGSNPVLDYQYAPSPQAIPEIDDGRWNFPFGIDWLPTGELISCWYSGDQDGGGHPRIILNHSKDQGQHWYVEAGDTVLTSVTDSSTSGGTFKIAYTGRAFVSYVITDTVNGATSYAMRIKHSDDYKHWSAAYNINTSGMVQYMPNGQAIRIGGDTLMFSFCGNDGTNWRNYIFKTGNNGESFTSNIISYSSSSLHISEGSYTYLGGGFILGHIRMNTTGHYPIQVRSTDNGQTWSTDGEVSNLGVQSDDQSCLSTVVTPSGERIVESVYSTRFTQQTIERAYANVDSIISSGVAAWNPKNIKVIASTSGWPLYFSNPVTCHNPNLPMSGLAMVFESKTTTDASKRFFKINDKDYPLGLKVDGTLSSRPVTTTDTTNNKIAVLDVTSGDLKRYTGGWPTGSGSGVTTVGTFSGSSQTNGASISSTTITFGPADGTNPGMISTGTQTLAGVKTWAANSIFQPTVTTGTGTTAGMQVVANSLTTGNGIDFSSSSITTGNLFKLTSTATVGNGFSLANFVSSGANGTSSKTVTGETISVTNTGTSSTNIGLNITASGATNNYPIRANLPSGAVTDSAVTLDGSNNFTKQPFQAVNLTSIADKDLLQYQSSSGYFINVAPATLQGKLAYSHTIFTPSTGGTVSLIVNQYNIINPSGALVALTVNLPSSPSNNDVVYIKYTQTITTVTYGNGTVVDGITAPSAGGLVVLTYDSGTTSWY